MDAGVIGKVNGQFDALESFQDSRQDGSTELRRGLEVRQRIPGPNGSEAFRGRAAIQRVENKESIEFEGEKIIATEKPGKTTVYTEFLAVPGEFVVVSSGSGEFAFNLIQEQTNTDIERGSIDIFRFAEEHGHAEPWQVGFYGTGGNAQKGVVYGEDVLSDGDIGSALSNAKKNQFGLEYEYDGQSVKMTVTESGYLRIFQPSNFDSKDLAQFVADEILHHVE